MKIVHVIFSLNIGGAETMLVDIINEQSKTQTVELVIVNSLVSKELIDNINKGVIIYYINRKPGSRNPFSILKFNFKVFKINPTVIHFHNHNAINLLKYKTKALTCLTIHDVNVAIINFYKYKKLFAISNTVQVDVMTRSLIETIRVYNGIRFDRIESISASGKTGGFKIIQVSRLDHEKKGQHILINAINILVKQRETSNIQLDFIGDGESLKYLKNLVKELNLENHVNFLGNKTREFIYKELKNYHLLVQPSLFEGFGLTVVEGIASKIPVLVSNIDGPMEIIDNGNYGYYFRCGDIKDCSDKILEIIVDLQRKEAREKIEKTYHYAKKKFNIIRTAENYINNYE